MTFTAGVGARLLAAALIPDPLLPAALAAVPALRSAVAANVGTDPALVVQLLAEVPAAEVAAVAGGSPDPVRVGAALLRMRYLRPADNPNMVAAVDGTVAQLARAAVREDGAAAHADLLDVLRRELPGPAVADALIACGRGDATVAGHATLPARLAWLTSPAGQLLSDPEALRLMRLQAPSSAAVVSDTIELLAALFMQRPALFKYYKPLGDREATAARLVHLAQRAAAAIPTSRWGRFRAVRALMADRGWPRVHPDIDTRPWVLAAVALRVDLTARQQSAVGEALQRAWATDGLGHIAVAAGQRLGVDLSVGAATRRYLSPDPGWLPGTAVGLGDALRSRPARLTHAETVNRAAEHLSDHFADLPLAAQVRAWQFVVATAPTFGGTVADLAVVAAAAVEPAAA